MKKYTFISEFRNGTYISQYMAQNVFDALHIWRDSLDIAIYTQRVVNKLQKEIKDEKPISIEGVKNVWRCSFTPYNSFLLLNIIETV